MKKIIEDSHRFPLLDREVRKGAESEIIGVLLVLVALALPFAVVYMQEGSTFTYTHALFVSGAVLFVSLIIGVTVHSRGKLIQYLADDTYIEFDNGLVIISYGGVTTTMRTEEIERITYKTTNHSMIIQAEIQHRQIVHSVSIFVETAHLRGQAYEELDKIQRNVKHRIIQHKVGMRKVVRVKI